MPKLWQIRRQMQRRLKANEEDRKWCIAEAKRLHEMGLGVARIAAEADVSEGAVRKWLKEGE